MTEQHFILHNQPIRDRVVTAINALALGPVLMEVVIRPFEEIRNKEQNAKLHAMCGDISKQVKWDGEWLSTEDWKRVLVAGWMKATNRSIKLVRSVDGNDFVPIFQRTSRLSKKELAELIEFIYSWGVEKEVKFLEASEFQ